VALAVVLVTLTELVLEFQRFLSKAVTEALDTQVEIKVVVAVVLVVTLHQTAMVLLALVVLVEHLP
jgi:hypothetical protein